MGYVAAASSPLSLPISSYGSIRLPPGGQMCPFLGRRYTLEELEQANQECWEDIPVLNQYLVRAFEVRPLIGKQIRVLHEEQIEKAVQALLEACLPKINLDCSLDFTAALRKHLVLHQSLAAPADTAVRQPMSLEIYGRISEIAGIQLWTTPAGNEWALNYKKKLQKGSADLQLNSEMLIVITAATYANIRYPGIGVPLY
jgi:hypothetical protein